ncbi:hypothetical protein ACONYI_004956, partial [Escherichia coli]
ETQLISLILSNHKKLNKTIDDIATHKQELSALDISLKDRNVSNSAKAQVQERYRSGDRNNHIHEARCNR